MSIRVSDYQARIKVESSEADSSIDMSDGEVLELVDPSITLAPTKIVNDINSNWAHPFRRKLAFGRDNVGNLPTLMHKADRELLMQLAFGGLSDGVPAYTDSFAIQHAKGSVAGQLALGVKNRSLTLAATAGQAVGLTYDLQARKTTKISAPTISLPATLGTPYRFATAIAVLNGAASNKVESINMTLTNNVAAGPHRTSDLEIAYLEYGTADLTGSINLLYEAETYNDLVRGTATGFIYLLFGDSMAIHDGTAWNTDDLFTASDSVITWDGSDLAEDDVASVGPLALTTLSSPSAGDVAVQNPVLIKLNAVEVPTAPEAPGASGVIMQTVNFEVTAPSSGTTPPVEVLIDEVEAS